MMVPSMQCRGLLAGRGRPDAHDGTAACPNGDQYVGRGGCNWKCVATDLITLHFRMQSVVRKIPNLEREVVTNQAPLAVTVV